MVLMLIGFTWYNAKTTQEQQQIEAARQDSLARVEALKPVPPPVEQVQTAASMPAVNDSAAAINAASEALNRYGVFGASAGGEMKDVTLENNKIKVTISTKGGMVKMAELTSDYVRYQDKSNIKLWSDSLSAMKVIFNLYGKGTIKSDELYFVPSADKINAKSAAGSLSMRLNTSDPNKFVEFIYSLEPDSYKVNFSLNVNGLGNEMEVGTKPIMLEWFALGVGNEKGISAERQKSSVFYREMEEEPRLSERVERR